MAAEREPQDYQYASESLDQFATYEDYLDSQLSETDLFYLEDEELARQLCIIFIRDKNAKGQEISGYIDYALRLKNEPFEPYFERKKKLLPKSSDLSYYNWETQTSTSNSTPNFQVIADSETGLLFKNKRDRKVVNVDPKANPGDNSTRTEIKTKEYLQVVVYDHMTRRKT
ncbi:Pyruvate kinase [Phytophthora cinnamomi]|uniref:Pyruvate kinase n=1 Tax=Phytophthora cinnamomi TaxID=4785 RepID=UPI00355AA9B1|nr:Pyruvate kinase [Phytophthora cinnamomi]